MLCVTTSPAGLSFPNKVPKNVLFQTKIKQQHYLPFHSLTSAKLLGVRVISQVGVIAVNSLLISSTLEPR